MKKTILIALVFAISCGAVFAESLWTDNGPKSMFGDRKARVVGDIVTIIIAEQATSSQKATTDFSKKTNTDINKGIGPLLNMIPNLGFSAGDKTTADGTTTRATNLNARLTAKVVEVQPNGNLVIEGVREVQTNKEKQTMKLTGIIRQDDIASDNSILSTYIADAKISHEGTGPIGDRQKEGIITRILRVIF